MVGAVGLLAGCRGGRQRVPAIGEAFVGPAALKIRADIPLDSATVATVKHGERLDILQQRRKFLRVRTPNGAIGWTEERQLLALSDMTSLKALSERAAKMPSQGVGATFGDLRVHTQPSLQAPSFLLIKQNDKFDVLAHAVVPRTDLARAPLIPPAPKRARASKKSRDAKVSILSMPKPPPLPPDWLNLSKTDLPPEDVPEQEPEEPAKPVPTDNWSLIRQTAGRAGWVLTRMIRMAIPDEVAQYAEGHRIVSYFSLGEVQDGDMRKNVWLWTTIGSPGPYDFDSFRVFVWSLRRHRYETAYIERKIQGYSPVLLEQVDLGARGKGLSGKYPGFSVCTTAKDGTPRRRSFALLENTVRYAGDRPCEAAAPLLADGAAPPAAARAGVEPAPQGPPRESLFERLKRRVRAIGRRR